MNCKYCNAVMEITDIRDGFNTGCVEYTCTNCDSICTETSYMGGDIEIDWEQ